MQVRFLSKMDLEVDATIRSNNTDLVTLKDSLQNLKGRLWYLVYFGMTLQI
jgi:hypothetical protein